MILKLLIRTKIGAGIYVKKGDEEKDGAQYKKDDSGRNKNKTKVDEKRKIITRR